jgi:hypothetical protein
MLYLNIHLHFAKLGENNSIWSALLEKAWAKLKGTYQHADGGFLTNGIRALTGMPVFTYETSEETNFADTW